MVRAGVTAQAPNEGVQQLLRVAPLHAGQRQSPALILGSLI
jgi:hypothetical protein